MANQSKGFIGERKVDYYLETLADKFTILQGTYLKLGSHNVQPDNILISPHVIYIVEVKNYRGTIIFDTVLDQFTRNDGKKITGFQHPITQVQLQALRISNWLQNHNYPPIPIHYFVATADPNTIIEVVGDKNYIASIVARGENIPMKILEIEKRYQSNGARKIHHQEIGEAILQENREQKIDVFGQYGIGTADIMPGVKCPGCSLLGMSWIYGKWHCLQCGFHSKHAHQGALNDYFSLIAPSISNKECRRFLGLESRSVVSRLLRTSNLVYENKKWKKGEGMRCRTL